MKAVDSSWIWAAIWPISVSSVRTWTAGRRLELTMSYPLACEQSSPSSAHQRRSLPL